MRVIDCGDDEPVGTPVAAQQACTALAGKTLAGATVAAAAVVPASGAVPTNGKLGAKITPALNIEVRIPSVWDDKLRDVGGCGRRHGQLLGSESRTAVRRRAGQLQHG